MTLHSTYALQIEKATAGGRMLARHHGQIVLVDGAIPGERVAARVERTGKGVLFAETIEVLEPSPDRRQGGDRRCGGNLLAHIEYPRQLRLKGDIIQDAFARIARHPIAAPQVTGSPERGYRMRARLHAAGGRLGFFREGTHELCAALTTGQLMPGATEWIAAAEDQVRRQQLSGLAGVELAENVPGDQRVCHLELEPGTDPAPFLDLSAGLHGLTAQPGDRRLVLLAGSSTVTDVLHARDGDHTTALRLRRDVRSFFQGNRFLLEPLVRHVLSLVAEGPVIDLYAGVGLFGLSLAATGRGGVTLVEGDEISSADLAGNAEPLLDRVRVERSTVEAFLASAGTGEAATTVIVDPPRTGLSRQALSGIVRWAPGRIVYVSCDVATLARDARGLMTAGYDMTAIAGMDLFPNTAHVETIATFQRSG